MSAGALRTGGVPEHFNFPWHRAESRACWARAGLAVGWTDYPGGTGAIVEALAAGELDVATVLTEGAVAAIARGAPLKVISAWTATPLRWGVHVAASHRAGDLDDLPGATFAISRFGSGSHLMAAVLASQRGWAPPRYTVVGDLAGARRSLAGAEADAFLWEQYTTQPVVDRGEWRRVGVVPTPWPGFVVVASTAAIEARGAAIEALLACLREVLATIDGDEACRFVASRYGLSAEAVAEWFAQTRWQCDGVVPQAAIAAAVEALVAAGVVDAPPPAAAFGSAPP